MTPDGTRPGTGLQAKSARRNPATARHLTAVTWPYLPGS
jgi:hypothetical protein